MGRDEFVDRLCLMVVMRMVLNYLFVNFPRMVWLFVIVITRYRLFFMLEILVLVTRMGNQNSLFVKLVHLFNMRLVMIRFRIERK